MDKYKFVRYNPKYKELFLREKQKPNNVLGKEAKIEHVGSSAVPGLGGKEIIDIVILSLNNSDNYMKRLEKIGFGYSENHPKDERRIFMKKIVKSKEKERAVHLHLCLTYEFWNSFIAFRDYLRKNKKVAKEHEEIKKKSVIYAKGDGEKYRAHKNDFLQKITKKALKKV